MALSKPWVTHPHIWSSEAKFMTYIRGVLRKGWSQYPIKLEFMKKHRQRIPNPVQKNAVRFPEVWGGVCEVCRKPHAQKDMEVDHKGDQGKLISVDDISSYVAHLFLVDESDLRWVCKPCHKIISYSQRTGKDFSDAALEKEVIRILKEEKVEDMLDFINSYDYNNDLLSNNAKTRRESISKILKGIS